MAAAGQNRDSPFDLKLPQTSRIQLPTLSAQLEWQNLLDAVKQLSTEVVPYITQFTANGTINPGDVINLFNAAGVLKGKQAKSNTILGTGIYIGKVALAAADVGEIQLGGIFDIQGKTFTPGAVQYLDTVTAGNLVEVQPAAGSIQRIGISLSPIRLLIRPEYVFS